MRRQVDGNALRSSATWRGVRRHAGARARGFTSRRSRLPPIRLDRCRGGGKRHVELVAPSLVLNWGFADRWEAVLEGRHFVELRSESEEPRLRVEDTSLPLKRILREGSLQEKSGPSIATEFGALLPTINGESGVGANWAVQARLTWSFSVGFPK
jgi:hypothetical protein